MNGGKLNPAEVLLGAVEWAPALAVRTEHLPSEPLEWGYELKWDGFRGLLIVDEAGVRLFSRRGKEKTASFPELQAIAATVSGRLVLDGEVVVLDADNHPSIGLVASRWHRTKPKEIRQAMQANPSVFVIFDVLEEGHTSLRNLPYRKRRRRLEELNLRGPHWLTATAAQGPEAGPMLLELAREHHFEGVVAKRLDSPYRGGDTGDWRKILLHDRQEFVVGGWSAGESNRPGVLHVLLLGYYEGGVLRFAGHVGNFDRTTTEELERWANELKADENPFHGVPENEGDWFPLKPELVAEVSFNGLGPEGLLRHTSLLGLRDDKDPADVKWEQPYPPPKPDVTMRRRRWR